MRGRFEIGDVGVVRAADGSQESDLADLLAGAPRALDSLGVFVGAETIATLLKMLATVTPRAWSEQPATFAAGIESVVGRGLDARAEPPSRVVEACVLRYIRGLRDFTRTAQRDPAALGSPQGRALFEFLRDCASSVGPDRFAEAILRAPGVRSISFLNGFVHLAAAAEPGGAHEGEEARLRERARTFAEATETVTKPLWAALGRATAAFRAEPEPAWAYLGAARANLEKMWSAAPTDRPALLPLLDRRIVTVRNAVSHAHMEFMPATAEAIFRDGSSAERTVRFSDDAFRLLVDEHGRSCITIVLAVLAVLADAVLSRLKEQGGRLHDTGPLIRLPPPEPQ